MTVSPQISARLVDTIAAIPAQEWDACALATSQAMNPFVSHAFLLALEDAGTTGRNTGWSPAHIVLEDSAGGMLGCVAAYLKTHSQGEYVFDQGWADAYERAGGRYYPKLQCSVPFSPVPGPRLLVAPGSDRAKTEARLASAIIAVTTELDLSSAHVTFLEGDSALRLIDQGFLPRTDQQFHWPNRGYATFDDFLGQLASRKRKTIRRERAMARSGGITFEARRGSDIGTPEWDAMYRFYLDTGSRKWGRPYLNRRFFSLLAERLADQCLLVIARANGEAIAGALNIIGGDCLFGRYWGASEHHPCLHFEVCYYQAIDYAIANRLSRVEAGAQGEHKLARGYVPVTTHSAHWIADPRLRVAIARYLEQERAAVTQAGEILGQLAPYKRDAHAAPEQD